MLLEKIFAKGGSDKNVKNEKKVENKLDSQKNYWESWEPELNKHLFVKRSDGTIEGDWTVSEIFDEAEGVIVMATKSDVENPEIILRKNISKEELSKINDKQNLDFTEAVDFINLYRLINYQKGLRDNNRDYLPEVLIDMIDRVRAGELAIDQLTEVNGLRLAVKNIVNKQDREG